MTSIIPNSCNRGQDNPVLRRRSPSASLVRAVLDAHRSRRGLAFHVDGRRPVELDREVLWLGILYRDSARLVASKGCTRPFRICVTVYAEPPLSPKPRDPCARACSATAATFTIPSDYMQQTLRKAHSLQPKSLVHLDDSPAEDMVIIPFYGCTCQWG